MGRTHGGSPVLARDGRHLPRLLLLLTLVPAIWAPSAQARGKPAGPSITVMTQNLDEGADFGPVYEATSSTAFVSAVAATWHEIIASNIPERAAGVAREIGKAKPDVVAIQEADEWYTGTLGGPANQLQYDQLQSLLDALAAQGLHYEVVAKATNLQIEVPDYADSVDLRLINHDALLMRSDKPNLTYANVDVHPFANLASFTIGPSSIDNVRGWTAADITIDGHTFRMVTTHLEGIVASTQAEQAQELVDGPGNTTLPVVFAGDFNSDAGCGGAGNPLHETAAYDGIIAAGYTDAWSATHVSHSGCTWPLHTEDDFVNGEVNQTPTVRIDLILFRNGVNVRRTARIGEQKSDLTPSGLWPSDHSGVTATLAVP